MYIEKIHTPADLRKLEVSELKIVADEVRDAVLNRVSRHGGHVGPNLGFTEATVALHYVFDTPTDKLVFDVSHQTYPHTASSTTPTRAPSRATAPRSNRRSTTTSRSDTPPPPSRWPPDCRRAAMYWAARRTSSPSSATAASAAARRSRGSTRPPHWARTSSSSLTTTR